MKIIGLTFLILVGLASPAAAADVTIGDTTYVNSACLNGDVCYLDQHTNYVDADGNGGFVQHRRPAKRHHGWMHRR